VAKGVLSGVGSTTSTDLSQVGDMVTSMLTEAQFQSLRSADWVLADGQNVAGSTYAGLVAATVPDARGQFLRGKNNGRVDGKQNPDGELALGTYQADEFDSHTHDIGGGFGASAAFGTLAGSTANATSSSTGGNETRSKNITVNVFIRIN
jgi:hypothetical protein